ncbi:Response regulator receiver domain-containing protein [Halovenus aranensis]|uniref:Response regulator receiver domain-containing protein n=1 Tax=Halovenus aranensis TaxID=890420 RepID=A0A1G8VDV2_9EURY|nr:GAF domain-containing protein [Halovenus aranensis]SDJ63515.1 Response regulator receiver domain-containing protein [Halovenus aranensis]
MAAQTVLVVDPDEDDRHETVESFQSAATDTNVVTAASNAQAIELLAEVAVDAVVTRYNLGDNTGLELVAHVREGYPETDCFLYAETTAIDTASFEAAVLEFVPKDMPGARDRLVALVGQDPEKGQLGYPLPDDEGGRLAALDRYGTLSEQAEQALADVLSLADQYFDVSSTAVTVVDEQTQRVVARTGPFSPPKERAASLSTHTLVSENGSMAVSDLRADQRFSEEGVAGETDIVAYLGAAIETPAGHPIGALNLYWSQPREFSSADRRYLATLADLVADVLVIGSGQQTPGQRGEDK